jgi:hypothetical protein
MADSGEINMNWERPVGLVAHAGSRLNAKISSRSLFINLFAFGLVHDISGLDRVSY